MYTHTYIRTYVLGLVLLVRTVHVRTYIRSHEIQYNTILIPSLPPASLHVRSLRSYMYVHNLYTYIHVHVHVCMYKRTSASRVDPLGGGWWEGGPALVALRAVVVVGPGALGAGPAL